MRKTNSCIRFEPVPKVIWATMSERVRHLLKLFDSDITVKRNDSSDSAHEYILSIIKDYQNKKLPIIFDLSRQFNRSLECSIYQLKAVINHVKNRNYNSHLQQEI